MSHKISHNLVTPETYLAHERASSETKHEFVEGYVVAMAGGTISHGRMIPSIARLIGNHLAEQSCDVFASGVRLKVESAFVKSFRYPDVMVSCEQNRRYTDMCEEATVLTG